METTEIRMITDLDKAVPQSIDFNFEEVKAWLSENLAVYHKRIRTFPQKPKRRRYPHCNLRRNRNGDDGQFRAAGADGEAALGGDCGRKQRADHHYQKRRRIFAGDSVCGF